MKVLDSLKMELQTVWADQCEMYKVLRIELRPLWEVLTTEHLPSLEGLSLNKKKV